MIFSVVICTYNRANFLKSCINSILNQDFSTTDYEVIVVDNGSTDESYKIVEQFFSRSKVPIYYVKESNQGLSFARNKGIEKSTGEFVAFIDDDAVADENWLKMLHEVYLSNHRAGGVGGKVLLNWLVQRPLWVHDRLLNFLGYFNPTSEIRKMTEPDYIRGGNMSFRKRLLEEHDFFNLSLGFKGNKLVGNEELELCKRIEKSGWQIIYTPYAIVYHAVFESKLTKGFFRRRGYYQGLAKVIMEKLHFPYRRFIFLGGIIFNFFIVLLLFLVVLPLFIPLNFIKGKKPFLFALEVHIIFRIGMLKQLITECLNLVR
jgi:glycosyltransferase involved in cell wall biosynthesis